MGPVSILFKPILASCHMNSIKRLLCSFVVCFVLAIASLLSSHSSASAQDKRQAEQILPPEIFEELFRDFESELGPLLREAPQSTRSVDRDRRAGRFEKMHRSELRKYAPLLMDTKESVVRIDSENETIAYGTVVRKDGFLVTKASELAGRDELVCHFSSGKSFEPTIVGIAEDHDLALLKVDEELVPIEWVESPPSIGAFLVSGDETGLAFSSGIVSVERRVLIRSNQAVLGVVPQPSENGIVVESVAPDSAAELAGLEPGDIVLSINDVEIKSVAGLTNTIRLHSPGERVDVRFRREGEEATTKAELKGRNLIDPFAQSVAEMNRFGAEPSRRASNFPVVIQHDSPLWPEQCGGPIIGLEGKAVGINIARAGRIDSYAIPADVVQEVVEELID